ncbi:MAG TPA: hypothetical protein DCE42_03970 [Myxococcales bacterium]|nr:hypothetical protein [Deltaproteobacteria bacterium]MBU53390.1 hypothetical protein [Deltaproteobacteria bacterium]HAA53883.1 hypothetical protein [Myxococcales bacterium]
MTEEGYKSVTLSHHHTCIASLRPLVEKKIRNMRRPEANARRTSAVHLSLLKGKSARSRKKQEVVGKSRLKEFEVFFRLYHYIYALPSQKREYQFSQIAH